MTHYGTLAEHKFAGKDIDDIRGSAIYGLKDDKLGKIDDIIFDHVTGDIVYVVIDTGGWLSSKKFIVPADQLKPSDVHKDDYRVDLTKPQIEAFPPYDEQTLKSQEQWNEYQDRYRSSWSSANMNPPATGSMTSLSARLGPRWSAFEKRLRADREQFVANCSICGVRPHAVQRDVEQKRKVG